MATCRYVVGEDREDRKGDLVTEVRDGDEIARDARWEWRLIYKALISIAIMGIVVVVREMFL